MVCKGLSFLLLFRSLEATWAKPTQRNEQASCKGGTCMQTSGMTMLQVETKQNRSDQVYLEEEGETDGSDSDKITSHAKFKNVEHWQDVMQYDLFPAGELSKGELVVSKKQWEQAFDRLDKNGDGQLDGGDLDRACAETADRHMGVSQEHYRLAVATMAQKFPEFAQFLITHEPALVFFSETNTSAPLDAPVPDDESMALFAQRTRKLALLQREPSTCVAAFGNFTYEVICVGFSLLQIDIKSYLGNEPPPDWLKELEAAYLEFKRKKPALMKKISNDLMANNLKGAAGHLWKVLKELFHTGAIMSLVKLALKNMTWWEWAKVGITMISSMTSWIARADWAVIAKLQQKITDEVQRLAPLASKAATECATNSLNA